MQKLRNLVAVLVISMFAVVSFAQDDMMGGTIVDVAAGNENFSTLVSLVQAAGLVETLSDEEASFTVFAPTNEAFEALPAFVIDYLGNNPDVLTAVLTYHVVPATVMAADVTTGDVETVNGATIAVAVDDMGVTVDGVAVTATDIEAGNGVIHQINGVLLPPVELPAVDPLDISGDISVAGSSTVFPLTERIAERFDEAGYADTITIDSIGSGAGFERFCEAGETDISNASRPIRESEIESCREIGRDPIEFRVGTDALAVAVSQENDFIEDVTTEELAIIFGEAELWSDVRPEWPAEPILRFIPGTDSGTFDYFVEEIFDENEEPILSVDPQLSEDDNVLVQGIQGSPFAIGFFGFAFYQENQDVLRVLSINGVEPNGITAEDGTYPLARPLFIYSTASVINEKPQVGNLINFYLTQVDEEVTDVGYFPASTRALRLARIQLLAALDMGSME